MRIITIFLISTLLLGCSGDPKPNLEEPMQKMNIIFPKHFKLSNYKYDWAIGESSYEYEIIISPKDYINVVSQIKNKSYFVALDSNQNDKHALDNSTDVKNINEVAYSKNNRYFYKIFIPNPGETITLCLENDTAMAIIYDDL